jgi:hypothetical protein
VLFTPGNHEYDAQDFDTAHTRLRETCERLGLHWLERETVVISGVRFVGTTLWTDFDALGPSACAVGAASTAVNPHVNHLAQQLKARERAFRAANYYLKKTQTTRNGAPLLADGVRQLGLECQHWLRNALTTPFEGATVAITHFAPSLRSADPRYGRNPGTAGFCNALDDFLPLAKLWLHGHLHAPSDYIEHGCRVVANPLGYARKNEQAAFQAAFLIEIGL